MKISRRIFLGSIPIVGAAIISGSLWLENEREKSRASQNLTVPGVPFDFQVTWNGDSPTQVNLEDYRLIVDGDVSNPLQLSLEDLSRMPSVQKTVNIACVMGWNRDVPWEGILVSYLLDRAGAPKDIDHLTFESVTGYKIDVSGSDLANPLNMIALKAGGAPLSEAHGYPARLVLPTRVGEDWVKYVRRITCTKT